MNLDDVRMLVQTVEARNPVAPKMLPGTVVSIDPGGGFVSVVVDGDPVDSPIDASPLVANLMSGDRVMVTFDPPNGVYVTNPINPQGATGQVLAHTRVQYVEDENEFVAPDNTAQASLTHFFTQSRLYRIDFTLTLVPIEHSPGFIYGEILNDNPSGNVLANAEDFFIGLSVDEYLFSTISSFRLIRPYADSEETLNVYLYPATGAYRGWFEVMITDVGPSTALQQSLASL